MQAFFGPSHDVPGGQESGMNGFKMTDNTCFFFFY